LPQNPRLPRSLNLPRLYAIVDVELCGGTGRAPTDVARAFLSAGACLLQLRCKSGGSGAFLELAHAIATDARQAGALLVINDRADIAALCNAGGLHVGQDDLTPADARTVVGAEMALGVSTHTPDQWERAVQEPVEYVAIGPVFGTGTKQTGYAAVGLEAVTAAAGAARRHALPTVAIGGITLENAASVIDAGAQSVAVISDLVRGDPEERCRAFLNRLA
jgi:thiamine-phosphate pyrophosphorylase